MSRLLATSPSEIVFRSTDSPDTRAQKLEILRKSEVELVTAAANDPVIVLADHNIVGDGVTMNSAAAVEALIAAVPGSQGCIVQYPAGRTKFDDKIDVQGRKVKSRGYGCGTSTSGTDDRAATLLEFPAGCTGIRIHHWQAQNSSVEDMRIIQTAQLATSVLASFVNGNTFFTLASPGDFQNGQAVQLEGAGHDLVLPDRVFATTNGSNVVTWATTTGDYYGNSVGYIGQEIILAGFPAGTTILSWGIFTLTLSNNASATASGLTATIVTPLVTEIVSGGGTNTLNFADLPYNGGKTAASRKLRHCAPGIYSSIQCHTRDLEILSTDAGMILAGITTGSAVADNGSYINSYFRGSRFGVVLQGADAQVNTFGPNCNFAGPEVGVLDQSYISNDYANCHWAFNCGMMAVASMKVIGGYMESGTSYISYGASSFMLGTVSFVPGSGFAGFAAGGGKMQAGQFQAGNAQIDGPMLGKGSTGTYVRIQPGQNNIPGFVRVGAGVECNYDGTRHWWLNVTQGGGSNDKDWRLQGQQIELWNAAGGVAKSVNGKLDLYAGITYSINGTQVLGPRLTGWAAATGTATRTTFATGTVTLSVLAEHVKALIDDLTTTGVIGA